jgi:DNA-binding MarR family transcriptional regulator
MNLASKRTGRGRPEVAAVADNFVALVRSFKRARAGMLAAAASDVEWSAQVLLKCIQINDGPMRASAVAESLHSDPSTVSRQVAALVKDGLLERRSDPEDGRASLLALTPKADDVLADYDRIRLDFFNQMLDDWSDADLRRLAELLNRFTRAHEAANVNWINDRIATRTGRAGSTN